MPTPVPTAAPAAPEYKLPDACTTEDAKACLAALHADCDAKKYFACGELGTVHDEAEDYAVAATMYAQACDAGYSGFCNNLGRLYKYGRGVERNPSKAAELFQGACNAKDMLSCNNLGVLYEGALGVQRDYARAKDLYTQACDGKEMRGCFNLGILYNDGHGVPVDPAKAIHWFEVACQGGLKEGCEAKDGFGK